MTGSVSTLLPDSMWDNTVPIVFQTWQNRIEYLLCEAFNDHSTTQGRELDECAP